MAQKKCLFVLEMLFLQKFSISNPPNALRMSHARTDRATLWHCHLSTLPPLSRWPDKNSMAIPRTGFYAIISSENAKMNMAFMVWYNWWSFSLGCATKWLVISHPIGLPRESPHLTSAFLHLIQFVQAWWRVDSLQQPNFMDVCRECLHQSKKIWNNFDNWCFSCNSSWFLKDSSAQRSWSLCSASLLTCHQWSCFLRSKPQPGKTKTVLIGKRFGMGIFSTSWISCDINDMNHRIDELSKGEKAWDQWSKNTSSAARGGAGSFKKVIYI